MNIEKLAKRLKEFTLDDIELIAECDCKTELEQLLNSNKILFENGIYKYNEETKTGENYEIFSPLKNKHLKISIEDAKEYFMKNYVEKYYKFETYRNYNAIFNFNIIPFINCYYLHEIDIESIKELFKVCELRRLKPHRIKNTMALLNQLIKYFQHLGVIDRSCVYQVKKVQDKNHFGIENLIFEGFYWKKQYDWDKKRKEAMYDKSQFKEDLQKFAQKLMDKIANSNKTNSQISQAEYYSLVNILNFLPELKENNTQDKIPLIKTELAPDFIRQIEREILGIE
ncbi:MAG: hypothetical protein KHX03_09295 [Clostridium sp.]|nr:hypothetical protein [Clostridium sp.]